MAIFSLKHPESLEVDIDAFADALGITIKELHNRMHSYAIWEIYSEARRLAHGEAWDKKLFPAPPPGDRLFLAASRNLLNID
jgi:hypothetical protein